VASLCVLVFQAARNHDQERVLAVNLILPGVLFPTFVAVSGIFLNLTKTLHPTVYDGLVATADGVFGVQPSFLLGWVMTAREDRWSYGFGAPQRLSRGLRLPATESNLFAGKANDTFSGTCRYRKPDPHMNHAASLT
jgi:hypothetical protein